MDKQELGKQIETLRKECGVSTYELEKRGIHPSLSSTIEKDRTTRAISNSGHNTIINFKKPFWVSIPGSIPGMAAMALLPENSKINKNEFNLRTAKQGL